MDAVTMIVGVGSGIGGALATVGAFSLAFRGLEKRVMEKVVRVENALAGKLDVEAFARCHKEMEKDMERGGRQFADLFAMQKNLAAGVNEVGTAVKLLGQKVDGFGNVLSQVTRVEIATAHEGGKQ
jgi:hypothetical protein